MSNKLSSEELSDIMIESLVLATMLIERFQIMEENKLLALKAKQSVKGSIPHLENYVNKVFAVKSEDAEHMKKGATYVMEIINRVDRSLKTTNLTTISDRKTYLQEFINDTALFPAQKKDLYEKIRDSGIIEY
jgi:hypothetical protein